MYDKKYRTLTHDVSSSSIKEDKGLVTVLFLIDRLGRGGAAQVVVNLALGLDREIYSPMVCVTRKEPAYGQDEMLEEANIPLIELNRSTRGDFGSWKKLWNILPDVDILHCHESGSNFWGRLWGRMYKVPIIITHDHTAADEKHQFVHLSDRMMSPFSDQIITVSQYDRTLSIDYEKLPVDKVVSIYNGIDVNRFSMEISQSEARQLCGLSQDKYLIAIIARLAPQKNHEALLVALSRLPEDIRVKTECFIIGTGDLDSTLAQRVDELDLNDQVSFLGERTDVPFILNAIDLLALPSFWECLPIVLLEALAAECPVVASPVGGVPEVLTEVGWPMVDPEDIEGLTSAIERVLCMTMQERMLLQRNGRKLVEEKFSREANVSQVEQLYQKLLIEQN